MTMFHEEPVRLPDRAAVERLLREGRAYRRRELAAFARDLLFVARVALLRPGAAGLSFPHPGRAGRRASAAL